jgi:hypothetical protein
MTQHLYRLATVLALLAPLSARAEHHVRSPSEVDQGELEIEHNALASFDRKP